MTKPYNPGYKPGDYWITCDRCGIEYRKSETKREWTGLIVCKACWESRHPQEFVRAPRETIASPSGGVRPEADEDYITTACETREAIAGIAIAGCAIAGFQEIEVPSGTFNTNTL